MMRSYECNRSGTINRVVVWKYEGLFTIVVLLLLSSWTVCGCSRDLGACKDFESKKSISNGYGECFIDDDVENGHCAYTCNSGFMIRGYNKTKCNYYNGWNPNVPPNCTEASCKNVHIEGGHTHCSKGTLVNSLCHVECKKGFSVSIGGVYVKCTESLEWNSTFPTCDPHECDKNNIYLLNGYAQCTNKHLEGSYCNYTCNANFKPTGSRETFCNNSIWTKTKPTCELAACSIDMIYIKHGQVKCSGAIANNYVGSKCEYVCDRGYFQNGTNQNECQSNGEWTTKTKPACEDRPCPSNYTTLLNGRVDCYGSNRKHAYNDQCHYKCNQGFTLKGSDKLTCTYQQQWNDLKPTCEVLRCNEPPRAEGGNYSCNSSSYEMHTHCNLTCDKGYKLMGSSTITCLENTAWTEPGLCEEIKCDLEYVTNTANGKVNCTRPDKRHFFGSKCQYTCDVGYALNGTNYVECKVNGEWSDYKPICENRFCSVDYTTIERGTVTCNGFKEKNRFGSVCSYRCNEGYALHGNVSMMCGIDQQWLAPKPECKAIVCDTLYNVSAGMFICNSTTNEYRTRCKLNCSEGYELSGNSVIQCNENRSWGEYGKCRAIQCPATYTKFTNGAVDCTGAEKYNTYGSRCTYMCNAGYILNGTQSVTCNSDGSWSDEKPVCEGRMCPVNELNIINGDVQCMGAQEQNGYNSTCIFKCNPGYELVGSSSLLCYINETWSSHRPVCTAFTCSKPPDIDGGIFICDESSYSYGTVCHLSCYHGYKILGASNITCMDNKDWSSYGKCEDVEPPVFQFGCPDDLRVSSEKVGQMTYVVYTLPNATDNSGSENLIIMGEPEPNTVFEIGTTVVNVTARDKAGNTGFCQFNITVEQPSCGEPNVDNTEKELFKYSCGYKYMYGDKCNLSCSDGNLIQGSNAISCTKDDKTDIYKWAYDGSVKPMCNPKKCPKFEAPTNGAVTCDTLSDTEVCVITCSQSYTLRPRFSYTFRCSKEKGTWQNSVDKSGCQKRNVPTNAQIQPTFYYHTSTCHKDNNEIKRLFIEAIKNDTYLKRLCVHTCVETKNITIECYNASKTRQKRDTENVEYKITASIDLGSFEDLSSPSETLDFYDTLASSLNEHFQSEAESGKYNFPYIGVFKTVDYADIEFICKHGEAFVYSSMSCAGCGPGFFYNNETDTCSPCTYGTYQDQDIAFSCMNCQNGTTTRTEGSISVDDCQDLCKSGQSSASGNQPCKACPIGTYQPERGRKRCIRCPFGMSTLTAGEKSKRSCQFFSFHLSDKETSPFVQVYDANPAEFTFLTWIKNKQVSFESDLEETASITIDTVPIYLTSPINTIYIKTRQWTHVALVFSHSNITLYVNGKPRKYITEKQISLLGENAIRFEQSETVTGIIVHGFQLTTKKYSDQDIEVFANSCQKNVDQHFLAEDPFNNIKFNNDTCNGGCGPGYYYEKELLLCLLCPTGFYQDKEVSTLCIKCPSTNTTGKNTVATSVDYCHKLCDKGTVYDITMKICVDCPKGTYQETAYSCKVCPNGKTTNKSKAESIKKCHDMCEPGQYSPTGKIPCSPCPIGTYQRDYSRSFCHFCPFGMSTRHAERKDKSECQYFDMIINATHGQPKVKTEGTFFSSFTLMFRVFSSSSDYALSKSSFSITNKTKLGSFAYLAVENAMIEIKPVIQLKHTIKGKWLHIAVLYKTRVLTLQVNGKTIDSKEYTSTFIPSGEFVRFIPSNDIPTMMITQMQFTERAPTDTQMIEYSQNCNTTVHDNLLYADYKQSTILNISTCKEDFDDDLDSHITFENNKENTAIGILNESFYNETYRTPYSYIEDVNVTTNFDGPQLTVAGNVSFEIDQTKEVNLVLNNELTNTSTDENIDPSNHPERRIPKYFTIQIMYEFVTNCIENLPIHDVEERIIKQLNYGGCLNNELCNFTLLSQKTCNNLTDIANTTIILNIARIGDEAINITGSFESPLTPEFNDTFGIFIEAISNPTLLAFDFEHEGKNFTSSVNVEKYNASCQDGIGIDMGWCYICPLGSYSKSNTRCVKCSKNYYQSKKGMSECVPCPDGLKTEFEGSMSIADCKSLDKNQNIISLDTPKLNNRNSEDFDKNRLEDHTYTVDW